jgi:hypothetical protein
MSTNQLNFDNNNTMLQQERNCVNFDGSKKFNVNYKAMSHDDKCFIDIDTRQSIGPGNYTITNLFDCQCLMPDTVKNATDNLSMPFKNGVGTEAPCVVDEGSRLRVGLHKKFPKCPQQLFERPYKTIPLMSKGVFVPDSESELIFAEDTKVKRSCNSLSGVSIPHQYTCLIDHISYNIQNEQHIVQEAVEPSWRRGGNDTRLVVRDYDYSIRCNKAYMNKSTNPDFWVNHKGSLLSQ